MVAYHTIVETNGHSSREGSEPGMDRRYARDPTLDTGELYLYERIGGAGIDL